MIKTVVIKSAKDFLLLKTQWNKFVESSPFDSIFLTHEWFSTFLNAFCHNKNLVIAMAYDKNAIVGIFPLYKKKSKFGFVYLQSIVSAAEQAIIHKFMALVFSLGIFLQIIGFIAEIKNKEKA